MEFGQGGINPKVHAHRNRVPYATKKAIPPAYCGKIVILTIFFQIVGQERYSYLSMDMLSPLSCTPGGAFSIHLMFTKCLSGDTVSRVLDRGSAL